MKKKIHISEKGKKFIKCGLIIVLVLSLFLNLYLYLHYQRGDRGKSILSPSLKQKTLLKENREEQGEKSFGVKKEFSEFCINGVCKKKEKTLPLHKEDIEKMEKDFLKQKKIIEQQMQEMELLFQKQNEIFQKIFQEHF